MGYRILFDDLTVAQSVTTQSFNACGETLGKLSEHVNFFANLPSLSGQAADRMKSYLAEVHGTLFASIGELLTEYQTRFILYKDDTFQLDSNLHAELDEETFNSLLSYLPGSQGDFQTEAESLKSAVDTISDLVSNYGPNDMSINNNYGELIQSISDIREKVGTNEHTHASNDLTAFKELLTSFEGLIASYMSQNKSIAIDYRSGSIAEIPAAQELVVAFDKTQQGRAGLEAKLVEVGKREEQRYEALTAEAAQARVDQGIWQAIGATLAVVAGAAAIVLTAGMATPIVVTALVAGSASMAYGYSNLFEAGQNIGFGLAGDATSAAFNPLRDTIFMGNQTAYDVFGFTATFVAGSMIPIGNAVNIAQKFGGSVSRAVIMGTGQSVATAGAGYFGGKLGANIGYSISKDWFGADERTARNIGNATGVVSAVSAGIAAYKFSGNIVANSIKNSTSSRLGSGDVGNFSDFSGMKVRDILSRIPKDATKRILKPQAGKVTEGFEYKWIADDGATMRVRVHGPDPSAPAGSYASENWIVRVQKGKKFFDFVSGEFQPPGIVKPNSPNYSESAANNTHIPIQTPK